MQNLVPVLEDTACKSRKSTSEELNDSQNSTKEEAAENFSKVVDQ